MSRKPQCVYLRDPVSGKTVVDGRQIYECLVHDQCVKTGDSSPLPSCENCREKIHLSSDRLQTDFVDNLQVFDRTKSPTTALRNLLAGRPAFLVCGGPSAGHADLSLLIQRGVWSLAVNNMAAHCRTNAFICADPPSKFHDAIWQDQSVMKFIPTPKLTTNKRGRLRQKVGGEFKPLTTSDNKAMTTMDCPNVWAFERRAWMKPDESFFTEPSAAWGNHDAGVSRTGESKTVCTFLLGLRILYYLGARTIYLVGVDFNMNPAVGINDNYVFGEARDSKAIQSNNEQYAIVNNWLQRMSKSGVFTKFGLSIYNSNPTSGLRAFEHVPFEVAVDHTLRGFPKEPLDLNKWYEK